MGKVKVKIGVPKIYEFGSSDLMIDIDAGDIYFKDRKGKLRKILSQETLPLTKALPQLNSPTVSASFAVITKNVTASANISSSGNIITTQITASGDLSASGEVIALTGSFDIIDKIVYSLGQISIQRERLNMSENQLKEELKKIDQKEAELGKEFASKYGVGNVDIETGDFTPAS